jgi:alkanesulfonate monooxygenase SsuD/methylene tetrahydromethanopterin reductase-like flavin-dependent oxidoreductase (luciferase family)
MESDYYLFNSYIPESDGDGPSVYQKWTEQVIAAEELGFGCAWFTEHHFRRVGGMLPNPSLLIGALAQHTRRIRLGTSVVLLPLRNPVQVAEDVAMLDILSNGRINLGVGRGMVSEFHRVFAVDPKSAQERFAEGLSMLQAALRPEPFTWNGTYFHCPDPITIMPRPVQQPHPPLWVPASRVPEHSRAIGRAQVNLMTLPWQPATFGVTRSVIDAYREGLREAGSASTGLQVM